MVFMLLISRLSNLDTAMCSVSTGQARVINKNMKSLTRMEDRCMQTDSFLRPCARRSQKAADSGASYRLRRLTDLE